jgi:hypothetical protein
MNFLEDGSNITALKNPDFGIIPTGFAVSSSDYSQRTPTTKGDSIGILLSTSTGNLNQPLQENISVSFTGIDLVTYTGTLSDGKSMTLKAQITNTENISGTGGELMAVESNMNQKMRLLMFACPTVVGWTDLGSTSI